MPAKNTRPQCELRDLQQQHPLPGFHEWPEKQEARPMHLLTQQQTDPTHAKRTTRNSESWSTGTSTCSKSDVSLRDKPESSNHSSLVMCSLHQRPRDKLKALLSRAAGQQHFTGQSLFLNEGRHDKALVFIQMELDLWPSPQASRAVTMLGALSAPQEAGLVSQYDLRVRGASTDIERFEQRLREFMERHDPLVRQRRSRQTERPGTKRKVMRTEGLCK